MAALHSLSLTFALSLIPGFAGAGRRPRGDRSASGTTSPAGPPVDPATLGRLEAILDYCALVSPQPLSGQKVAAMMGHASEKELDEARSSPEYRAGHEEVDTALPSVPQEQGQEACSELGAGS